MPFNPPTLVAPEVERGPDWIGHANREGGTDRTGTLKIHLCAKSQDTPALQHWCFVIPRSSLLAFSSTATGGPGLISNSLSENWLCVSVTRGQSPP